MDLTQTIQNRRSIRQYTAEPVSPADLDKIIQAGIWAPSGMNKQPWKFKIVEGEAKTGLAKFTKHEKIIDGAAAAICVFMDKSVAYDRDKDLMGIGACIQNMLLQAHALGIGTCWIGEILNRKQEVEAFLSVPADCELMAVITCGRFVKTGATGNRRTFESFVLD